MDETQSFQDPETCPHNAFRTSLSITKIAHQGADIQRYMADVRVYCDDCNTAFRWLGLPTGASFGGPMRSADGLELRAPIAPEGERRVADVIMPADGPLDAPERYEPYLSRYMQ